MGFRITTRLIVGGFMVAVAWILPLPALESTGRNATFSGEWQINECTVRSKTNATVVGGRLTLPNSGTQGELVKSNGTKQPFKLIVKSEDSNASIIRFEISIADDDPVEGGGGPRKGILRYLPNGQVEILETLSATQPFPTDFSVESKRQTKYYKLSPAKKAVNGN